MKKTFGLLQEDPHRAEFLSHAGSLMKKLVSYAPVDAAVDQKAREFLYDCLPPALTPGNLSSENCLGTSKNYTPMKISILSCLKNPFYRDSNSMDRLDSFKITSKLFRNWAPSVQRYSTTFVIFHRAAYWKLLVPTFIILTFKCGPGQSYLIVSLWGV